MHHTNAYTVREDILIAMNNIDLTAAQVEVLLASSIPLADIYRDWNKQDDFCYIEDISATIEGRADTLIQ